MGALPHLTTDRYTGAETRNNPAKSNTSAVTAKLMKNLAKKLSLYLARVPGVPAVAHYIATRTNHKGTYPYYRELFIDNGRNGPFDSKVRADIVRRFEQIHAAIPTASSPTEGLILAEGLLSMEAPGDIVECGCFAGGSSAKLSIIAKLCGKRLIVCDSFEGLPAGGEIAVHARRKVEDITVSWVAGDYSVGLEGVRRNIEKYGEGSVCSFVKGWFSQTLTGANLPETVAAAFVDVDLNTSARDCLVALWPRLANGGIFFSHDTAFITVLQHLHDEKLWRDELKSFPPIFFGAGFGVCDLAPHLGYMVKGADVSAAYLKNLTLDK
jgi:O-methyltransferase